MPKPSKKSAQADTELSFEEALGRLESLVQGMESDQVPLEKLIENYEEGTVLYQICEKRLGEAQGRIEIIRKKRNGTVNVEPFGETEEPTENPARNVKPTPESNENGQLF